MNPILYYIFVASCVLGFFSLLWYGADRYGADHLRRQAGYRPHDDE